jgi:endonuclease III
MAISRERSLPVVVATSEKAESEIGSPRNRLRLLQNTLHRAKVRYARKKGSWLSENFKIITKEGAPSAYTKQLLSQRDKDGKIRYLRKLAGIGEQNARNLVMNVYDPDFRDSIKVDLRIKKISEKLGLRDEPNYQENFYCRAAKKAGLGGWELDRLLYNFTGEFLCRLDY